VDIASVDWSAKLEPIMRDAGNILFNFYGKELNCTEKQEGGFVTEADLAAEKFLMTQLGKLLPEADFVAEESGISGNGRYQWVIDPLDGTTNFTIGFPLFAIAVALTDNEQAVCGAIFIPMTDEFFYAQRGNGAWLNGHKIQVSEPEDFGKAVIGVSLPYARRERIDLVHGSEGIIREAYATRRTGSSCIDLAYVACGRFDGAFFTRFQWWDVAPGIVLVQEAGGLITDFEGNSLGPKYQSCLAGGRMVHDRMTKLLKK
jgi:myo-inositol-1(or 4)-monophosphatase